MQKNFLKISKSLSGYWVSGLRAECPFCQMNSWTSIITVTVAIICQHLILRVRIGNSGSGLPSRLPPKTINSTAFITGVFVEKDISKKSKISLGINYKYFSTINKTGNKIDSAQTAYNSVTYPTTYTNTYRNNFSYLELPVSLKFQLTNNNSLPVYWLAGINISRLINTNALQFKSNHGVYYRDNSLFNKTQLGFSTGFFATLFSHKKTPVNIGPYFYYNATRLANEGLYDKKHFNSIGISAEMLFNKKSFS